METSQIKLSLPELFLLSGEWDSYQEGLYSIFEESILKQKLYFRSLPVRVKFFPKYKGKCCAFWHLISEGGKEEERTPDLRRCERIAWIGWIIKNCDTNSDISWWEGVRKSKKNIVLWHEKGNYAVILAKRNNYYLLKTAYVPSKHRIETFRKEREKFHNSKTQN